MAETTFTAQELQTLSTIIQRSTLARALGETSHRGDRDYYKVLGYPLEIDIATYRQYYNRHDIAARVVDLPPEDTWRRPPPVTEDGRKDTPFTEAWLALVQHAKVFNRLSRIDKLSGIGHFGILVIGIKDGKDLSAPAEQDSLSDLGPKGVLYLHPFGEDRVTVKDWVEEPQDPRYGQPESYNVTGGRDGKDDIEVHWTRTLHVAEGKTDNEAMGTPRLQRVFNRMIDITKLVGGTSEATWLNMRQGVAISPKEEYEFDDSDAAKESFLKEIKRYLHDPARVLRLSGSEATPLGPNQVMDPTGPFAVAIGLISAASSIPQRVLLGSAKGELAAAREDLRQWYAHIADRQTTYAEPEILIPFIERMLWLGALPQPAAPYTIGIPDDEGEYRWPALYVLDEVERAELRSNLASATKDLSDPLADYPLTPAEQRELLGYPAQPPEGPAAQTRLLQLAAQAYDVEPNQLNNAVWRIIQQWEANRE